ncbi:hypothetical protein R1sor_022047 [Riccia sorocarpa]|uniref:Uncharacterized protein n=1 Tax=Riccia sorocarpa TaxID=122646 RepID=A0ABD3GMJ9_9MARC
MWKLHGGLRDPAIASPIILKSRVWTAQIFQRTMPLHIFHQVAAALNLDGSGSARMVFANLGFQVCVIWKALCRIVKAQLHISLEVGHDHSRWGTSSARFWPHLVHHVVGSDLGAAGNLQRFVAMAEYITSQRKEDWRVG